MGVLNVLRWPRMECNGGGLAFSL